INLEPLLDHFRPIVIPLNQRAATLITDPVLLGPHVIDVVHGDALQAGATPRQAANKLSIRDLKQQISANMALLTIQNDIQTSSLRNRARKPVENESRLAIKLLDALLNQPDDNGVRNQRAFIHEGFGFETKRRTLLDRRAKHVARRELRPL